jgi:hypothetical protein
MKGIIRYILFLIVSLCYLQAVLEINTDTITNTWFDEYDTYIHVDNSKTLKVEKIEHHSDFTCIPDISDILLLRKIAHPAYSISHFCAETFPDLIFLKHHALLI